MSGSRIDRGNFQDSRARRFAIVLGKAESEQPSECRVVLGYTQAARQAAVAIERVADGDHEVLGAPVIGAAAATRDAKQPATKRLSGAGLRAFMNALFGNLRTQLFYVRTERQGPNPLVATSASEYTPSPTSWVS